MRRHVGLALAVLCLTCVGCLGRSGPAAVPISHWQLLVPGMAPRDVTLPGRLPVPETPLEYVLRSEVAVPPGLRGQTVSISALDALALATLQVDGRPAQPCDASERAFDRYRSDGSLCWHFTAPRSETARLELRVRHTTPASASFGTAPALVAGPSGGARFETAVTLNRVGDLATTTIAWLLGALYLLVYLLDRTRRAHLWFALEAFGASAYAIWWSGAMQPLFGAADRCVLIELTCAACLAFIHFTHAQLGIGRVGRTWKWILGAGMVAALPMASPFAPMSLAAAAAAAIFAATAYQVVVCVRALRRSADRVVPATIGLTWLVMVCAAPLDVPVLLGQPGIGGGIHFIMLATAVIGVGQGALLARQHVMSLRDADRLNADLRRQMAERSRQLADALAQLSEAHGDERLRPDDVVGGRYRVERVLGAGGMGEVYEIERLADERRLALKLLHGGATRDDMARLAREAEIAAEVTHPNLVAIVDVDVTERHGLYLVMELLEGGSLDDVRRRWGDVPWALSVLTQVCDGLAALHEAGVVHRDLKPANVLLAAGGTVAKISDFGIATFDDVRSTVGLADTLRAGGLTRTGVMLGTPHYMAPELAQGSRKATPAVDVFALGVLAHELLGVGYPFVSPPVVEAIHGRRATRARTLAAPAAGAHALATVVDARIAAVLDACLDADPARRPTARAIADALRSA